jgi:glucose dehydrogenase
MRGTSIRRAAAMLAALMVVAAIAACGGSSKSNTTPSAGTSTSASSTTSAATSSSASTTASATTEATTTSSQSSSAASLWSLPNANPEGTRDVSSDINSSNVSQLKMAWKIPIVGVKGTYGVFSSTPVFGSNGTAYLQDLGSNVSAINVKTGKLLWRYKVPASGSNGVGPNGVTLVGDKIYGETKSRVFALQASTGEQLWETPALTNGGASSSFDIAPQVVDGKVYLATAVQTNGGIVYALDASTGKVLWRFHETPGAKSAGNNGGVLGNGGSWGTPVVENGLVYFGVANPYRTYNQAIQHPSKVLYNDSTVALDANTGKLKWYYQAVPNDFYDWDMQIGPMYTADGPGGQPTVIDAGKMGYVYAMNATTGKLDWKTAVGKHNGHDNDSVLAMQHKLHLKIPFTVCPGPLGGVETQMAMAGGVVYVPANDLCDHFISKTKSIVAFPLPNSTTGKGDFEALNVDTGKVMWDTKLPSSPYGSASVTNDLVFTTLFNGKLIAMNRSTGKIVWSQQLPANTNAPVAIDGDTLVTVASFPDGPGQKPAVVGYSLSSASSGSTATNTTTSGSTGTTTNSSTSTSGGGSSAAVSVKAGMSVFESTCASCHTLAAAGSTGTVGPNLDQLKPSDALVIHQVTNGGGGMPAFGSSLSKAQIASVAAFVSSVAGKPVKGKPPKSSGGGGGP